MKFSINEIIDMAVELEETGFNFYNKCAEKFSKEKTISELFMKLASEEKNHKEIFSSMLENISDKEGNFPDEYYDYLSAIISGRIFKNDSDIDAFLQNVTGVDDVISAALTAEKDSVIWYSELKEVYNTDDQTITILNDIINEEKSHILQISKMIS